VNGTVLHLDAIGCYFVIYGTTLKHSSYPGVVRFLILFSVLAVSWKIFSIWTDFVKLTKLFYTLFIVKNVLLVKLFRWLTKSINLSQIFNRLIFGRLVNKLV
jgi:hypothetical protein